MSQQSFDALIPGDRERIVELSRQSIAVMRGAWDTSEAKARQQVIDAGVKLNDVDMPAFRQAAAPLLAQYRQQPEIDAIYRRIRDFAGGAA